MWRNLRRGRRCYPGKLIPVGYSGLWIERKGGKTKKRRSGICPQKHTHRTGHGCHREGVIIFSRPKSRCVSGREHKARIIKARTLAFRRHHREIEDRHMLDSRAAFGRASCSVIDRTQTLREPNEQFCILFQISRQESHF